MRVLYDLIHARAAQNWHQSINKDNYSEWANHWIATAKDIQFELIAEGLIDTANAMYKIIEQQKKFIEE